MSLRLEGKWIDMFVHTFRLCGVKAGDVCAVLSETQSRPELAQLSELALQRIGARAFHLMLPGQLLAAPVPVRSTGASDAIGGVQPVVQALAGCVFVADCTVEGLQHAPELPQIWPAARACWPSATNTRRSWNAACPAPRTNSRCATPCAA